MKSPLYKCLNDMVWNSKFFGMDDVADMYNLYVDEKDVDKKARRLERLKAYIVKYELPHYKELLKEQSVYVVEGNLSMLTPWQHNIKNIIALLGSNISHTQICLQQILKHHIDYLCKLKICHCCKNINQDLIFQPYYK